MVDITDVAERAGVSSATVSRYLRGERVRAEEAIRAAIAELQYWPHPAARSLRSGLLYAVALIVPDITNPYFAAVAKGVESIFRPGPYSVFLHNTDESLDIERGVLAEVVRRVDGIILVPATEQDDTPLQVREAGVPLVFVDRAIPREGFDAVLVDNLGGARAATEHLLDLGHTAIALLSGPVSTTPGRGRYDGFLAALSARCLAPPPEHVLVGAFREDAGYQSMLSLLSLPTPPTAVFCANNTITIGALKALRDMQVHVPDDISVVGFDDLDLGPLLAPPLTAIARPAEMQGVLAARLLLARMQDKTPSPHRQIILDVELVVRSSCAPPRSMSFAAGQTLPFPATTNGNAPPTDPPPTATDRQDTLA